jgi:hypothetical protein
MAEIDLRRVAVKMQLLDLNVDEFVHARPAQEERLNHEAVLVMGLVCATDQPFHFRFVKTLHSSPAIADRLQSKAAARLLDYIFGLVISEMVLAPEPRRLRNDVS